MKKKLSVEHFVGVLKQAEVGVPVAGLWPALPIVLRVESANI